MSVLPKKRHATFSFFILIFSSFFILSGETAFALKNNSYPHSLNDFPGYTLAWGSKSKKSKKTTEKPISPSVTPDSETDSDDYVDPSSIKLNVPNRYATSFFRTIPDALLKAIEIGTPDSIYEAVSMLKKADGSYTESEKTLLYVAAGIMRIVWPTEKITWEIPEIIQDNAYVGAINSAEKGVYDSSTGSMDFLTLVLPSLVLLTNNSRNDYYEDAKKALALAEKINENSVLVMYLSGHLFLRMKDNENAMKYFEKAWKQSSEYLQTSYVYAQSLFSFGRFSEAAEIALKFAAIYPKDMNLLKLCAKSLFSLKRYQDAELYVARVLQQNPADSEYILFRAKILVEEGDFIKASSLLDVYARTDSTSRDYLLLRSRVLSEWNKNIRGAADTIEKALERYPDDLQVLFMAAKLAAASGERIGGKTSGELASAILVVDPENAEALEISIKDLIEKRKWEQAYSISTKIIGKAEVSLESKYAHISICLALNRMTEASRMAKEIYEKFPNEELAVQAYLEVLYALGKYSDSLALIEKLLPSASSHLKSFLYYRRSFLANGEQAVLSDLRSSLIANSRNEDSLFRLYKIYFEKKDYRRAQYYLKQVVALHPANEEFLRLNRELEVLIQQ